MDITPVDNLNLAGVLRESKRIISANYSHFLALSLLFFPLSCSLIVNPALNFSDHLLTGANFHKLPPNDQNTSILPLLYILIVYVLSLCATATITYSTHHGFNGKPVNFFTAMKSLIYSFFPLVITTVVANVLLTLISLSFLILIGVIFISAQTLGYVIDYNSIQFMLFSVVVVAMLFVILIYYHVNWSLVCVVVVAESKWGFSPLKRSSYLIKGMKSVSLSILFFYGIIGGVLVYVYSQSVLSNGSSSSWGVFFIVLGSSLLMMLLLQNTAANAVLYNYCKALHGELAIDIGEFAHGYVNLPSDDVITVVTV